MLAPRTGKTKTGRLWTYVRDDRPAGNTAAPAVWFAYSPDRKGEHPERHLRDFRGTLQADAYVGFNQLYEGGDIREAACRAHVRRKFYELQQAHASPIATEVIERIGQLYRIESEIRSRPSKERRELRQSRARPVLESLHEWLESCLAKLSSKSDTTAADRYALSLWNALVRYSDDGRLEIDNNAAERTLRAVALGRKNYLFAGVPGTKVLLTSDYHMYRAHRAFTKAGLDVLPRPFPDARKRGSNLRGRWPVFLDLMVETVKIGYYRTRGWI